MSLKEREIGMVVAVALIALGGLIAIGVVMQRGGVHGVALPSGLASQAAPAESDVSQVPLVQAPATSAASSVVHPSAAWIAQVAARTGIPATAIDAYGVATLRIGREQPKCHLGWTTLAGVGTIESANGTTGGRRLLASGLSSQPISGPLLNGAGGYAAISDGQGGWSSARGPMQFIESTWDRWGADANGDGIKDVNNIFDAALAAGHYLCANGRDMATSHGWTAGIYSYNHDVAYVRNVYAAANAAAR